MGEEITDLPGPERGAALLKRLVRDKQPVLADRWDTPAGSVERRPAQGTTHLTVVSGGVRPAAARPCFVMTVPRRSDPIYRKSDGSRVTASQRVASALRRTRRGISYDPSTAGSGHLRPRRAAQRHDASSAFKPPPSVGDRLDRLVLDRGIRCSSDVRTGMG